MDDVVPTRSASKRQLSPAQGAWVLGGIFAGVLAFHAAAGRSAVFAADDVALGRNTVAFTAEHGGALVGATIPELPRLVATARAAREAGRPFVLWLGASQCYAINRPHAGDRTAVAFAAEAAEEHGSPAAWIQCASPNSNAHELLCMYLAFRQAALVPRRLVVAFTYDDLKEPDIRDAALALLQPLDAATLEQGGAPAAEIEAERARLAAGLPRDAGSAPIVRTATSGTPQERLEDALEHFLERNWSAWSLRGKLAARSVALWKMPVTTVAFRVFDRPQVAVPPDRAQWNRDALHALLELAAADGARVLVYQAPHHPGLQPFYHPRAEYDREEAALAGYCAARGFDWLDLESLVPAKLWGETNNFTPDVFHFQVEGHRLLGRAIEAAVRAKDG